MPRLSLVFAAACLAACGGPTGPLIGPEGTYALVSIGGQGLPVLITVSDSTRVIGGAITLRSDARFVVAETDSFWVSTVVPTRFQQRTLIDSGNWVLGAGGVVNLQSGAPRGLGFFSANEIRFASGQGDWIYSR